MPDIKIYNKDCLEFMKEIPDGSVDLIVTDPPYDIHVGIEGGSCSTHMGRKDRFKNENVKDSEGKKIRMSPSLSLDFYLLYESIT